jgi:primosomal protein N'
MLFAEVVIDTTTRELGERLFTYHVPEHLKGEVFVGSQVLIPFGNQELISGYVVALHDDISATQFGAGKTSADAPRTRGILEVLEGEPLFDPSYVQLLHWVADYYAASIAEVIAAAIPSDVGTRLKRVARLAVEDDAKGLAFSEPADDANATTQGPGFAEPTKTLAVMFAPTAVALDPQEQMIIRQLEVAKSKTVSLKTLKQRSGITQSKFYAALSRLRQAGLVIVENENETKVAPKTVQCVILTGEPARTKKQEEIVLALGRAGGQMACNYQEDVRGRRAPAQTARTHSRPARRLSRRTKSSQNS